MAGKHPGPESTSWFFVFLNTSQMSGFGEGHGGFRPEVKPHPRTRGLNADSLWPSVFIWVPSMAPRETSVPPSLRVSTEVALSAVQKDVVFWQQASGWSHSPIFQLDPFLNGIAGAGTIWEPWVSLKGCITFQQGFWLYFRNSCSQGLVTASLIDIQLTRTSMCQAGAVGAPVRRWPPVVSISTLWGTLKPFCVASGKWRHMAGDAGMGVSSLLTHGPF